jgi:signal transduction histidine kinase
MRIFDLLNRLQKLPKPYLMLLCAIFICLVTAIDWFSGPDLSTSIFYLLPISLAAWLINRRAGVAFSLVGTVFWFATDYFTNVNLISLVVLFWNAMVRLGFFLIVVMSLATLRRSRQRQEDLTAFVIHDLRAPLGNMLTALDMLQATDAAEKESTWRDLINLGLSSGQRMLNLVDSLLDLSRLESGKLEVQRETVLVADLFAESVAQVVLTAEFKQVSITWLVEPVDAAVFADPSLTQRILVNLLNNAIKFSPQQGIITLQAAEQNDNVIIAVHDEGEGVPVEWQQRVFAKYGQVSGGKFGGSGLGLTFCKLAVEAQNGRIWLESETGRGTSLHFSLPTANETNKPGNPGKQRR